MELEPEPLFAITAVILDLDESYSAECPYPHSVDKLTPSKFAASRTPLKLPAQNSQMCASLVVLGALVGRAAEFLNGNGR